MSSPIEKLVHALGKLPGIGERTAMRLAFFLLRAPKQVSHDLSTALRDLHDKIKLCSVCCNLTDHDPCRVCVDERREKHLICVVEDPSDVTAIEKTGSFKGGYHVLHGALSPLEGISPDDLKIPELLKRLHDGAPREIILATDANVEGDATSLYLHRLLKPLGVKITRLASGIPAGGELEYLDVSTLSRALQDRREI
ncbi:MAG: recombination mediator RecR [Deltaproteobacteria bacterium]|nr:recombination mediator RecR [Deltaproteobacteria bacterium]MDZ4224731.1 recombination mediator RecR [bacterium]